MGCLRLKRNIRLVAFPKIAGGLFISMIISQTRMHSSRMRTTHSLPYGGVPWTETPTLLDRDPTPPGQRPPLPGQRPPPLDRDPWRETTPGQRPRTETPRVGSDIIQRDPHPPDRQTLVKILPYPKLRLRAVITLSLQQSLD